MAMLYYVTLAIGGTLVLVSLLLGGDHDHDVDADVDLDVDVDADADADFDHGGFDALDAWLPFMSLRFWTFCLAFFGLTGTLLTTLELGGSQLTVGLLAGGMGYVAGVGASAAIRKLRNEVVDSSLRADDYVGESATVMVPIARGKRGKVLRVRREDGRAVVEKVNLVKRHRRADQSSKGGILEIEAPIHLSNLAVVCTKCDGPRRVGFRFLEDGTKIRMCKRCGEALDK